MLIYVILISMCIISHYCHPIESTNTKGDLGIWQLERISSDPDHGDKPWRGELELWLSDFENTKKKPTHNEKKNEEYDYFMQADEPRGNREELIEEATLDCADIDDTSGQTCVEPQCSSDEDCQQTHQKCCFNGCVHICSPVHKSAPLIDWIVQPKPRKPGSSSWLVDFPSKIGPNRAEGRKTRSYCTLNGRVFPEGEKFAYERHICHCHKKKITCRVVNTKRSRIP